jgi:hypothetical protein
MARDAVSGLSLWAQLTLLAGIVTVLAGAVIRPRRHG